MSTLSNSTATPGDLDHDAPTAFEALYSLSPIDTEIEWAPSPIQPNWSTRPILDLDSPDWAPCTASCVYRATRYDRGRGVYDAEFPCKIRAHQAGADYATTQDLEHLKTILAESLMTTEEPRLWVAWVDSNDEPLINRLKAKKGREKKRGNCSR